jgi:hypothetical protein
MRSLALCLVLAASSLARAGSLDPPPPGSEPLPPGSQSAPAPAAENGAAASSSSSSASSSSTHEYDLGARIRYVFVPGFMMSPFLQAWTAVNGVAVGIEGIRRNPTWDLVLSLDMTFPGVQDGNYLGSGKDPMLDTHYTQFRNISFLSLDVAVVWHVNVTKWMEFRYGFGIGVGAVLGDVLLTNNSDQVCNQQTFGDTSRCYPISPSVGPIRLNQPDTETKLKATENPNATDVAQDPHRHVTGDKPPVLPVINFLIEMRFKILRHLAAKVDAGFRNAPFVGVGAEYCF